jgi:hypothetical protein
LKAIENKITVYVISFSENERNLFHTIYSLNLNCDDTFAPLVLRGIRTFNSGCDVTSYLHLYAAKELIKRLRTNDVITHNWIIT